MTDKPQIKCPNCKTSMPYTAAECPNCKRRMVAMPGNPNSGSGTVKMVNKSAIIGGLIAALVLFALLLICCSPRAELPEEREGRQRQKEIQDRRRQEQIRQLDNLIEKEKQKK
jgi:hypothetical protein